MSILHGEKVYSGSDWMPQDRSINSLATNRGLVVRYPVRMKEDLLPYTRIPTSELRQLLAQELDRRSALQISMYGSDQYVQQYDLELGAPWKNRDLWLEDFVPVFRMRKD